MPQIHHQKHGKIVKPQHGRYGRHEWAIVGTPCGNIQRMAAQLHAELQQNFVVGYMDADHNTPEDAEPLAYPLEYTNKITHHGWLKQVAPGRADYWEFFNDADLVLVNGNHFEASQQVVVIDPKKYDSLKKRLPQLTNVAMWVYTETVSEPFDFIREAFPQWQEIPATRMGDLAPLTQLIHQQISATRQPISGLVLAGGKSVRMGNDKTVIDYHGVPQREYLYEMLKPMVDEVYLSVRQEQLAEVPDTFRTLPDSFLNLGPYGAILSALQHQPDRAWLVVAVDMPYVPEASVKHLITERNASQLATAYRNPDNELPEPLLSLWEPKAYGHLLLL